MIRDLATRKIRMNASVAPAIAKRPRKKAGLTLLMERVLEECVHASLDFSADPVHDLRVALRRCRSIADALRVMDPDPPTWRRIGDRGDGRATDA